MRTNRIFAFAAALIALGGIDSSWAQVQSVVISKNYGYIQTGPGTAALDPASNNFGFGADVNGNGIGNIAAPTLTGPYNGAALEPTNNGGRLVYSPGDTGWRWGTNADDFGTATQASLDSFFPNGTYTITVNGVSVPLSLTGNAYPNMPLLTLGGGSWSNGKYVIDVNQPLTVTTNAFTAYGSHADDHICAGAIGPSFPFPFNSVAPWGCTWLPVDQFHSTTPSQNFATFTIPANSLIAGDYLVAAVFEAIVDQKTVPALPGSRNLALYGVMTGATVSATGTPVVLTPPQVVFPISVSSNVTATSATATAQISPPASQVGKTGSVYVFAHARLSAVSGAKREALLAHKDGPSPDPCVLAQLNSSGQLTSTSASTMQAYTTGVLSSQTQSVSVLNNVPTSNVMGATFLVGYGTSASDMLASGNYEGAVSVFGASPCSTALLASAAPLSPAGLSGMWWNPSESGWGIGFVQRRNVVFGAWYTYDSVGKPKWYVASNCTLPEGNTGTSGTCTGTLYQVSGPTFFGAQFNPALRQVSTVGTLSIAFQDANTAMMTWVVNGQSRTVPIVREAFWTGTTLPAIDYTDLWWNPNESGWGMVITQQYGVMFFAWYVYDGSGNPVWYVVPNCSLSGSSCSGAVYGTTGPPLGPTFDHNAVQATAVGTITANFIDANNASITYTVNGVTATKSITRETF